MWQWSRVRRAALACTSRWACEQAHPGGSPLGRRRIGSHARTSRRDAATAFVAMQSRGRKERPRPGRGSDRGSGSSRAGALLVRAKRGSLAKSAPPGDNGEVTFVPSQTAETAPVQHRSRVDRRDAGTWSVYARSSISPDGGERRLSGSRCVAVLPARLGTISPDPGITDVLVVTVASVAASACGSAFAGLRFADASVMPRITRDSANVPLVMLVGPVVDLIRDKSGVRLAASGHR